MYRNIWCSTCLCFIFHGRQADIFSFMPEEIIVSERAIGFFFFIFFLFVCVSDFIIISFPFLLKQDALLPTEQ